MRIISGTHKGRVIKPPEGLDLRPTTDFAKESLFNILNNRIDYKSTNVLDLFSGTGSISYEFASRGASSVTAVEINQRCVDFIKKAADSYGFANIRAVRADSMAFMGFCKVQYELIFADPPFDFNDINSIPEIVFKKKLLCEDGLFILEHSKSNNFSHLPQFVEQRNYGKVNFSFFGG